MLIIPQHTNVLIIGAGPSGLMMAAQLLRYGVQPIIIDSKEGPTNHSKALAVQARSLEIYQQMGIIDKVVHNGKPARGITFNQDGKKGPSLALTDIGEGQTRFPYLLMYQQSKNERLLLDYLTQNCCPVYWNTTLTSLSQKVNGVEIKLQNVEGNHTLTCDWAIGADGAHSLVRKELQLPFKGDTYPHLFYLLDAEMDNIDLKADYMNMFLSKNNFAGFFPMPEENSFRVIGNLPEEFTDKEDVNVDDILPYINQLTKSNITITQNNWFTTYKLHHRMADKFRVQRCFLIGDAAHIHSPVGGQGMNTGLQDAYNLAWKLAAVINNQIKPDILDTYAAERMPVAKDLLKTTDRVFNIIMSKNFFIGLFKKWALFKLLNKLWKSDKIRLLFFRKVSQIEICYPNSDISLHLSKDIKVKAGDRLPYLKVFDEKKHEDTDIHEWCNKPGFTLIILGKFDELYLFTIAKWITQKYPGTLNFFYLPPSGKNVSVFDGLQANPHGQKAFIIRPDMYIGYINDVVDINMMDNYLQNVVGITPI
jgi:2-polyprenyl-6-methoxyphenol hydroxylase-like FAD-dependent oxidoreductase